MIRTRHSSPFLSDVGVNLLVVPAGIFFLPFAKWYVVGNAANSSIGLGIFLSDFERNTDWPRRNAARPIKLDVPGANVLFGFLGGISWIPSRIRPYAKPSSHRQCENAKDLHLPDNNQASAAEARFFTRETSPRLSLLFLWRGLVRDTGSRRGFRLTICKCDRSPVSAFRTASSRRGW